MSDIKNTAHIVVTIIETEGAKQPILQYSCSGINDLELQESKEVMEYINSSMTHLFNVSHAVIAEENFLPE